MNVSMLILRHARGQPDHAAVVMHQEILTYAGLNLIVRQSAEHLVSLGVSAGDKVLVSVVDERDHLVLMLALALLGAITISVDWRSPLKERITIARGLKPSTMLLSRNVSSIDNIPAIGIDEAWKRDVAKHTDFSVVAVGGWDRPLFMMLSSGTTGTPKVITVTHGQWYLRSVPYRYTLDLGPGHRYFSALPLSFTMGKEHTLHHLLIGNTVIVFPLLFRPAEYVNALIESGATAAALVPSVMRQLLALEHPRTCLFPQLKSLDVGGSPVSTEDRVKAAKLLTPHVHISYGTTETGKISTEVPAARGDYVASDGFPVAGMLVEVVDEEGTPLPQGLSGRLRCKSGTIASGFTGAGGSFGEEETFRDGWFYTSDIGLLDENGRIHLRGRSSNVVLIGGIKVFTEEVEAAIRAHPKVKEVAVVGCETADGREHIVAFVVADEKVLEAELAAFCKISLASYKNPNKIILCEQLPKTASGKIVTSELKTEAHSHFDGSRSV